MNDTKLTTKIPVENEHRTAELLSSGWIRLKEPKNIGAVILRSFPISVLLIFLNCVLFYFILPSFRQVIHTSSLSIEFHINLGSLAYVLVLVLFILLHEIIHGLFIPGIFSSDKTLFGFNGLSGFAYTEEVIGTGRYLIISIMPLLILSFLLPILLALGGYLNSFLMFCCILNAAGACVDILNMLLIAFQVPAGGKIVNNGLATFYR